MVPSPAAASGPTPLAADKDVRAPATPWGRCVKFCLTYDRTTDKIADLLGWDDTGLAPVEARLVLGTAVSELSEHGRRILQWRFVDERTQQEIADLVGLTQAQVSRILARVLARLRADLTDPLPAA
jgi:RNA polymerase sigma-B factor